MKIKAEKYSADKNGFFKMKETKEYRNFMLQVSYGTDDLFMDENNYAYNYNSYAPEIETRTFLFYRQVDLQAWSNNLF